MTGVRALQRLLLAALAACALLMGTPAWAQTAGPLTPLPAEVKEALPEARQLGQTRLRVWGFQIYDARLWASPNFEATRYTSQPAALELSYLRDFEAKAIAERSIQEMRRSASISTEQENRWLSEMQRVFPNIKTGDRLLGIHQPGQGARFWFNGQTRGEIRDAEFAKLFFGIWLSPKTSEPAMREALLGARP